MQWKCEILFVIWVFKGVVEYLSSGGVADNHKDFKELRYSECLTNFNCNGKTGKSDGSITHSFQLKSAYESNLMPFTNYTYDFKVGRSLLISQVTLVSLGKVLAYLMNSVNHNIYDIESCAKRS